MKNPAISIIIPAYNEERNLERCIQSCFEQTLADIEVVCVNDGSTDNTARVLDQLAKVDARLRPIHKHNQGVVQARAAAVAASMGTALFFLDADDYLPPDALEVLFNTMRVEDADMVCGGFIDVRDGKEISRVPTHTRVFGGLEYANHVMQEPVGYIWGKLVRRECFKWVQVDPAYTYNEDLLMNVQMAIRMRKIVCIAQPVYYYCHKTGAALPAHKKIYSFADDAMRSKLKVQREIQEIVCQPNAYRRLRTGFCTLVMQNAIGAVRLPVYTEYATWIRRSLWKCLFRTPRVFVKKLVSAKANAATLIMAMVSPRNAKGFAEWYSMARSRMACTIEKRGVRGTLVLSINKCCNWIRYRKDLWRGYVTILLSDKDAYKVYIPMGRDDHIQRSIAQTGRPYEESCLKLLEKHVGKVVVAADIGANIGNHTLWFAKHMRCERVYSFEPVAATFDQLQRNIKLNGLHNVVVCERIALGSSAAHAVVSEYHAENIGGTRLAVDEQGEIRIETLDHYWEGRVDRLDLVKIDTEGFEVEVIRGGMMCLEELKPWIFIECSTADNKHIVSTMLKQIGYEDPLLIGGENWLFKHNKRRLVACGEAVNG